MELFWWRKFAEHTGFVLASLGLMVLGFVQGFQSYSFTIDFFVVAIDVLLVEAVASSFFFTGFIVLSGLLFFKGMLRDQRTIEHDSQEKISCIIPNYYDSEVVDCAVKSILESTYENFEVLVVCVEGDSDSIKKMEKLSEDERVDYIVNPEDRSSKAENVNRGVEVVDSDLIAVFDADQVVSPDFLGTVASFTDSYDVIQGRHLPRPENFVSSLAYYESIIFDYIARQISYVFTDFRLAGSNCVLIKKSVFKDIGGYDRKILTEDFDFSHRCYKNGVKVKNINVPATENEASRTLRDWWGQRKRWMTGYLQVFTKLIKKIFTDYKGYRSFLSVLICGGSILGSLLMLTLVSKFLVLFLMDSRQIYLLPIASMALIALGGRVIDYRQGNLSNIGVSWVLAPFIFPFFSLITIKALFEFVFKKEHGWYKVDKEGLN